MMVWGAKEEGINWEMGIDTDPLLYIKYESARNLSR